MLTWGLGVFPCAAYPCVDRLYRLCIYKVNNEDKVEPAT